MSTGSEYGHIAQSGLSCEAEFPFLTFLHSLPEDLPATLRLESCFSSPCHLFSRTCFSFLPIEVTTCHLTCNGSRCGKQLTSAELGTCVLQAWCHSWPFPADGNEENQFVSHHRFQNISGWANSGVQWHMKAHGEMTSSALPSVYSREIEIPFACSSIHLSLPWDSRSSHTSIPAGPPISCRGLQSCLHKLWGLTNAQGK